MTTTVQLDSAQASESAEATIATAQPETKPVAGPYPVPERFKEQLANLPDSISAPIEKQLQLMPDSAVLEINESGHKVTVLYKTNAESREANARQDSVANAGGSRVIPIAKAKLGNKYVTEQGTTETFTLGKLVEFQATGLIIVMIVIVGLCLLTYLMNYVLNKFVLSRMAKPKAESAPVQSAPVAQTIAPAKCTLDPNAPSVHPGFTNKQLQAFLSIAAISALDVHPGLTNERLAVIFAVAAAEVLGGPCRVIKFKPQQATEWAWTTQGRAELISNGL